MKKNMLKLAALSICLIALSSVNAQTEDPVKKEKMKRFAKIDTSKDQKLSFEEYQTFRSDLRAKKEKAPKKGDFSKRFKQIDLNSDGFLDRSEFKNRKATKVKREKKS